MMHFLHTLFGHRASDSSPEVEMSHWGFLATVPISFSCWLYHDFRRHTARRSEARENPQAFTIAAEVPGEG